MILKGLLSPVTKSHEVKRILKTHPLHLFRIIQDVDQYSKFLPLCTYSQVLKTSSSTTNNNTSSLSQDDDDPRSFKADLTVGFPPFFEETYTSLVHVVPETLTIETKSIQSTLFDSLQSRWKLNKVHLNHNSNNNINRDEEEQEEPTATSTIGCHIDFVVTMAVSDPVIIATLDQVLREVAERQVDAFDRRCQQVPYSQDLLQQQQLLHAADDEEEENE